MKIECDKCGAKYSIADEKVRGKTFKIRCKKCSNVIIVRDKGAAAGAAAAAAVEDQSPGWHLAINGETVGPMAEDEVRQRYEAGEIDKETAIWQEGFEDWVPLGDVEVFASLPDRDAAAAAAEDPFASANQDDYAAPAAVGAGAAVAAAGAAAAAAPVAEQRSPRVSQLTGQRNENSVLFSLDSLQALATGGGGGAAAAPAPGRVAGPAPAPVAARAAANPSKGLATSAPSSEGSGLIDIRALGAMVGGGGGGGAAAGAAAAPMPAAADDAALPSFGGGGLGGLTSAPLVPQAAPVEQAAVAAAVSAPQPRSQAPLYIMMTLLLLAVLGLVAFIALREPDTKIVKETVTQQAAAPAVADKDEKKDEDEDKDDKKDDEDKKDEDDKDEKSADDGEDGDGEDADGGSEAAVAGSGGKKKKNTGGTKNKKTGSSPTKSSSGGGGDPLADALGGGGSSSSSKKKSSGGGDPGVECILDPSKCGGGGGGSKKSAPKKAAPDPSLPEKLTSTDIKAGVGPHKGAAKACGGKHGAAPGEKVTVKLSIAGATGKVTSASATGKHAGTALGSCVAAALKKASFKKFQKSSLGVQYPIRF